MYCIKCGVQMTDGQKKCPLCGTRVYHPDFVSEGDNLFPKSEAPAQEYNKSGILFVIGNCFFQRLDDLVLNLFVLGG